MNGRRCERERLARGSGRMGRSCLRRDGEVGRGGDGILKNKKGIGSERVSNRRADRATGIRRVCLLGGGAAGVGQAAVADGGGGMPKWEWEGLGFFQKRKGLEANGIPTCAQVGPRARHSPALGRLF
jgi:hypothetical protein